MHRIFPRSPIVPAVVFLTAVFSVVPAAAQVVSGDAGAAAAVDPDTVPRPTASAVRAAGPIVVDGRLDEATWQRADSLGGFVQSTPQTGHPATEPTVVRVLYDRDNLYIAAICYDSDPSGIIARSLEQDYDTHTQDVFAVTLDTYLDRRNSFMFLINPNGAVKDGQTFNNSRNINLAWEGVVRIETTRHDEGWTVEMAIPLTTLRFDPSSPEQDWGMQFLRRVRRKNEDSYWAPVARRDRVHRMEKAGTLAGLEALDAGRNLSAKPFGLAARTAGPTAAGDAQTVELDGGVDAKWAVTPGLTLDLTYGTDFSQVEVDREQVNLTRFPLFFPEKRDFFVENSGVFTFGDVTERNYRMGSSLRDFTLFHSRRIGLTGNGRPIPILAGGRLTGRAGAWEIGLLEMQTEAAAGVPPENFAVARLRRNVSGSGDVGAIFVNRQATGADAAGEYNRSFGADANLRLLDDLIINAYIAGTATPGGGDDNGAARVSAAWRDPVWDASAFVKRVGSDFDPGVGFVRRRGMRQGYATLGAHPRPPLPFVQEVNPYVEVDYIADADDAALATRRAAAGLAVDFLDGGRFSLAYADRFERLEAPFPIQDGAEVPVGSYGFGEATASYNSNASRPLSATLELTRGGFFNGRRTSGTVDALWRPDEHLALELSASRNRITLPERVLDADVFRSRVQYGFSTTLFASGFVQYNAAADQLVTNVRLNWMHAPLSDVFLVYTERRDRGTGTVMDRALTAKVTKLLAF